MRTTLKTPPVVASTPTAPVPLLCNLSRAAALLGCTRYQLWGMQRAHPEAFPLLRLGKRKRLVDPLKLKSFIESTFASPPSAPPARRRGRPRKLAADVVR